METHITVLRDEAVASLQLKPHSVVVDATFGSGGHALTILNILSAEGTFIGLDADKDAITQGEALLKNTRSRVHLCYANFRTIDSVLQKLEITGVDAILADLGWRMEQFSGNGRGFSFKVEEPLLMTFGEPEDYLFTARDIVNDWAEHDIANVLKGYGEEQFARRIAAGIVQARQATPIETTTQLAEVIKESVPPFYRTRRTHPATKSFQALRIAVNDELAALTEFIHKSFNALNVGGRLAIISFHSIEDRIVKQTFRELAHDQKAQVITKKPITASDEELSTNPRARSAKLRVIEKI